MHLRLWAAQQQQQLQQQLQRLVLHQYRTQDEPTATPTAAAAAAAAAAVGERGDSSDSLLQQLEVKALAALRSRLPLSGGLLRFFPFLSLPAQQQLVAAAPSSLLSLLQRHFGAPQGESHGAPFSWVRNLRFLHVIPFCL